jgi:two-component system chemotaxis response regulator CheY
MDSAADDMRAMLSDLEARVLDYERATQIPTGHPVSSRPIIECLQVLLRGFQEVELRDAEALLNQMLRLVTAHEQRSQPMLPEAIDSVLGGIDLLLEVTRRPQDAATLARPYLERMLVLAAQVAGEVAEKPASSVASSVEAATRATPLAQAAPNRTRRILIVEDDFVSRSLLLAMLERYGRCDVAVNGVEAVTAVERALAQSWQYDLITLDIMMPELGGHEALAAIRISETTKRLPHARRAKVVMTTALSDYENFHRAYLGSCDAYIVKPITKAVLVRQLRRVGIE